MAPKINIADARRAYEEAIQEAEREKVLFDEEGTLHSGCFSAEDVHDARDEGREEGEEAWDHLRAYGSHGPECLSGALATERALHPLCTCGWNHVATQLERHGA
jgi:hypothetical protein